MYKITSIAISLALVFSLFGCTAIQNANKTQKGAVVGAGGGALIGGLIGGKYRCLDWSCRWWWSRSIDWKPHG